MDKISKEEELPQTEIEKFLHSEKCRELITKALTTVDNFFTEFMEVPNDVFLLHAIEAAISCEDLSEVEIIALAINTDRVVAGVNRNFALEQCRSKLEKSGFTDQDGNSIKVELKK